MNITQTFNDFKDVVNKAYKIDDLASRNRRHDYALARHTYCGLMRSLTDLSSERIGKSISRNHSTVLHSDKIHKLLMKTDKIYRERYRFCEFKVITIYGYEVNDPIDYLKQNLYDCTNMQLDHLASLMKEFIESNKSNESVLDG